MGSVLWLYNTSWDFVHREGGSWSQYDKWPVFPESALVLLVSQQIKGVKGPFNPRSWLLWQLLQVLEFFPLCRERYSIMLLGLIKWIEASNYGEKGMSLTPKKGIGSEIVISWGFTEIPLSSSSIPRQGLLYSSRVEHKFRLEEIHPKSEEMFAKMIKRRTKWRVSEFFSTLSLRIRRAEEMIIRRPLKSLNL